MTTFLISDQFSLFDYFIFVIWISIYLIIVLIIVFCTVKVLLSHLLHRTVFTIRSSLQRQTLLWLEKGQRNSSIPFQIIRFRFPWYQESKVRCHTLGVSFRWSFGPNSAWGRIETTTRNRHSTLHLTENDKTSPNVGFGAKAYIRMDLESIKNWP